MDNFNPIKSLALFLINMFDDPSMDIMISCVLVATVICMIGMLLITNLIQKVFGLILKDR